MIGSWMITMKPGGGTRKQGGQPQGSCGSWGWRESKNFFPPRTLPSVPFLRPGLPDELPGGAGNAVDSPGGEAKAKNISDLLSRDSLGLEMPAVQLPSLCRSLRLRKPAPEK